MNPRKLYAPSVLGTLALGGLAFLATSQAWERATVKADGVPSAKIAISGTDAVPIVSALAIVVVAAALATLAASARVRRLVGLFITAIALVAVVVVWRSGDAVVTAQEKAVHDSPAFIGTNFPHAWQGTSWSLVAATAFVAAAAIGLVIVRFGAAWPTMGRKYEAPKIHRGMAPAETEADIWKALDEGRDPTK